MAVIKFGNDPTRAGKFKKRYDLCFESKKVHTREFVLPSSFAKYQSMSSKILLENRKISPKFPSFAKVHTHNI